MNFVTLSSDWSIQSRHAALRLLRRLRRQVRLLNRLRFSSDWSSRFQPAKALSRIAVGRLAQIDRTAKVSAPTGTLIRLGDAVQLERYTRLSACQEGEIILETAVSLGLGTEIIAQAGCVEIGSATSLGPLCRLFSAATLKIGRNCQIGREVRLDAQSGLDVCKAGGIVIEDHCWIGNNVQIAAGVTIGQHSVIGDDAVIVRNVPAFSVAAGSPAKTRNGALREVADLSIQSDYRTLSQIALKSYLNQLSQR